jgi:hypothetical protein
MAWLLSNRSSFPRPFPVINLQSGSWEEGAFGPQAPVQGPLCPSFRPKQEETI